jgi:glc operon protein GlcG
MAISLPEKKSLTLEASRVALAASEAEAQRNNWRVVIAVVDDGGHAIVVARLDGAQWSSIETAVEKARAAVAWKRPTRLLEESINNGRTAFLSIAQGMAVLQGGGSDRNRRSHRRRGGGVGGQGRRRRSHRPCGGKRFKGGARLVIHPAERQNSGPVPALGWVHVTN